MRLLKLSAVILLAVLILLGQYGFHLVPAPPPLDRGENALWIGVEWVQTMLAENEYQKLAIRLQANRIRYLFVYTTWFTKNGEPRYWIEENVAHFASQVKRFNPEARVLAWVGIPTTTLGRGEVNLDDPVVRDRIAGWCARLITLGGIDGVHLNAEPVPDGSVGFLLLLDAVRRAIRPRAILSIAGEDLLPQPFGLRPPYISQVKWGLKFYYEVARRVDQIVLMSYDSGLPLASLYGIWTAWQACQVLRAVQGTQTGVWIGIPAHPEWSWTHVPWAERVESGLWGLRWGVGGLPPETRSAFRGVALYAEWTMDGAKWKAFEKLWLNAGE